MLPGTKRSVSRWIIALARTGTIQILRSSGIVIYVRMFHHILARSRGHLEATMVDHDLDICIHAVRFGLAVHFRYDPSIWFRGEQLTGALPFLACADLPLT